MKLPFGIVLGSSSPRRLDLLRSLFPEESIRVLPPCRSDETEPVHVTTREEIIEGLLKIACDKNEDVSRQLPPESLPVALLTADTGIIVKNEDDSFRALGKPPAENYRETVRSWFNQYYLGKTHEVVTACCLSCWENSESDPQTFCRTVVSEVTMSADLHDRIDWYLDTQEPLGKAGGYAIQGAGSLFVEKVTGSISNIIGLPLRETCELIEQVEQVLEQIQ